MSRNSCHQAKWHIDVLEARMRSLLERPPTILRSLRGSAVSVQGSFVSPCSGGSTRAIGVDVTPSVVSQTHYVASYKLDRVGPIDSKLASPFCNKIKVIHDM